MVAPPNVKNYSIGKGQVFVAPYSANPVYVAVGNCPSVAVEHKIDRLEHFSSMSGIKTRDAYPVIQVGYTVTFETDEICAENLARFVLGTVVGDSISALSNVDADYCVKFVEDKEIGDINRTFEFSKCKIGPNGAGALISDEWGVLSFTAEGLYDATNTGNEWYEIRWTSTTTS